MKFEIKNRWSGAVMFECELSAEVAGMEYRFQLGFAVKKAVEADANLAGANLADAYLADANLAGAYLAGAKNIPESWLTICRDDLWAVLSSAPLEVPMLRQKLVKGEVDGSCYEGACACLLGTIANIRGADYQNLTDIKPNSKRPAEQYFFHINEGDTPETNEAAKNVLGWIDTWYGRMVAAFGPQVSA